MQSNPNPQWHDQEEESEHQFQVLPPQPLNWAKRVRIFMLKHWNPEEVQSPKVDPELPALTAVERSAEVFRFTALSAEHWLSPKGALREWLRLNAKLFVLLLAPAVLVAPLVTTALEQLQAWASLIAATTSTLILFPLSALLLAGLVLGGIYLVKTASVMRRRSPRLPPQHGYYD